MKILRVFAYASLLILISSCRQDDATPTSPAPVTPAAEKINGIAVPPEPNPTLNGSTIAGVDSDLNGIRDDVDRKIAQDFGRDAKKYTEALTLAKAEQNLIVVGGIQARDAFAKLADCTFLEAVDGNKLTYALLDSPERMKRYGAVLAGAVGRIGECK